MTGQRDAGDRLAPMVDFLDIAESQRRRADQMLEVVMAIRNVLREAIGDDAWRSDDAALPGQIREAIFSGMVKRIGGQEAMRRIKEFCADDEGDDPA